MYRAKHKFHAIPFSAFFSVFTHMVYIYFTLFFFPLKHPNRLLQTYSACRKTLDDPKWTNHISRGIIVVCDVKVTLRGFGPRGEASGRAGCISRSPELDPPPAQGGTQEQETSEHRYKSSLCHSIQFRLCRVSVIERQILNPPCVCECVCVSLRALC